MAFVCLFCGQSGGKRSNEDVFPIWIREVLGIAGLPVVIEQGAQRRRIREDSTIKVKLGDVCTTCNNVWMSQLEGSFKALMASAIRGRTVWLTPADQILVALWATKVALLLERSMKYIRGRGFAPTSHFRWLYDHRSPPPTTRVWIGGVRDFNGFPVWGHTATVRGGVEIEEGYLAAFTVGHVLFQVLGAEDPSIWPVSGWPIEPPLEEGPYLIPLWPDQLPEVIWPPSEVFRDIDFLETIWRSA